MRPCLPVGVTLHFSSTKLFGLNFRLSPPPNLESAGNRVPCGDAAPGPEMNSPEHQASFLLPEHEEGLRLRAEGVRGGVRYKQTWKQCSKNNVKYKRFHKKNILYLK